MATIDATDVRTAARKLGVTPRAVQKMIRRGDLKGEKIGGSYVIPRSEVHRAKRKRSEDEDA